MILTGKAKEDFLTKMSILTEIKDKKDLEEYFMKISDLIKNAYYVDFFDSVGIYISLKRNCQGIKYNYWYFIITDIKGCHLNDFLEVKIENDSRQEATEQAIIKANEIYNSK